MNVRNCKLLAFLLAVCLVAALVPGMALAEDSPNKATFAEGHDPETVINNSSSGDSYYTLTEDNTGTTLTITRAFDVKLKTYIQVTGGNLNIVLQGHGINRNSALTATEHAGEAALYITGGNVTITNPGTTTYAISSPDCPVIVNGGTLTIGSHVIIRKNNGTYDNGVAALSVSNGTVNINGGSVGYVGTSVYASGPAIAVFENGVLNLSGGATIKSKDSYAIATNGSLSANAKINISRGTIESTDSAAIYLPTGTLSIGDKANTSARETTITGKAGIVVRGGKMEMHGGVITATAEESGTLTVGDAGHTVPAAGIVVDESTGYDNGSITITGTTHVDGGSNSALVYAVNGTSQDPTTDQVGEGKTFNIEGGVFSGDVTKFVDTTKKSCVQSSNGEWVIGPSADAAEASVTYNNVTTYYETFVAACKEAQALSLKTTSAENVTPATVTLLKDAEGDGLMFKMNTNQYAAEILDFNNHTYTVSGASAGSSSTSTQGLHTEKGNKLTLKNGTLRAGAPVESVTGHYLTHLINNYGDLDIDNMVLETTYMSVANHIALCSANGKVNITGTQFVCDRHSDTDCTIECLYWGRDDSVYDAGTQIKIDSASLASVKNFIIATEYGENYAVPEANKNKKVSYVEFSDGTQVGMNVEDTKRNLSLGIVRAEDGTLKPYLPEGSLSYTALKDTSIVEDCNDQTMWVEFATPIPTNTWLWFEIKDEAGHTWGIAGAPADGKSITKYAWSFLNEGQFEIWPAGVEEITDGTYTVTCYALTGNVDGVDSFEDLPDKYLIGSGTVEVRSDMVPQTAAPEVTVGVTDSDGAISNAAKNTAMDGANMENLSREAMDKADRPTNSELNEAKSKLSTSDDLTVVVQTYMDVDVTSYDSSTQTLTYDITPKYRVVATTATNVNEIDLDENGGKNAVVIPGSEHTLTVTEPVTLTLGVPGTIANSGTVYIKHEKANGKVYYYSGEVTGGKVTFTNPHGFSTFTLYGAAPGNLTASSGGVYYESLQEAVNDVADGGVITLLKDCEENVTVSREVTFALNKDEENFSGSINAGSYYVMTQDTETSGLPRYTFTYSAPPEPSTYPTTVTQPEHGAVTASPAYAVTGGKVTLTVKPDDGYVLDTLTVTDSTGKAVTVTDNGDGTYTFTMPQGGVTVKATFKLKKCDGGANCPSRKFPDLDPKSWYHEYTDYVITHSLMNGNNLGLFDPDGTVTRATVVMTLWNYENRPVVNYAMQFTDVKEGQWYTEAIRWAASEGIVGGYGDGTFQPDKPVNREELAKILYGYEQKYGSGGFKGAWMFPLAFADSAKVSDWAYESVAWCTMNGVITGKPGNLFNPAGSAKRSDLAAMLTRYFQLAEDAE